MITVVHALSAVEAHAICNVLWATEHIPVDAHVDDGGVVDVWPVGRAVTTQEEVTALRAFAAVSDSPLLWHQAVAR